MYLIESLVLAFVLSLDCFAISISQGLKETNTKQSIIRMSLLFGLFQALMFIGGFYTGTYLFYLFTSIGKYVSAGLLIFIAFKMIKEGLSKEQDEHEYVSMKEVIFLSIATSIDAFAAGISFTSIRTNLVFTFLMIGLISFVMSIIGGFAGKKIGNVFGKYSEVFGGVILVILAFKTFFDN